ncbi:DUF2382 domain-containing protein [Lichenibacterium minor]|uniref:DUF2382 domain-containing protein n=2 Tax=Lichenibacterium minor TaxID=2316528 RepID=A0A4Q2U0C3_9HYPH|nr:DUF2382 domain-containing protein [Lichenibacterium minor]
MYSPAAMPGCTRHPHQDRSQTMSDTSEVPGQQPGKPVLLDVLDPSTDGTSEVVSVATESDDVLQVVEESLTVTKLRVSTGGMRIGTRTEVVQAVAEAELDRYRVEVTRVPVGRVVVEAPKARAEGDTTIVPVMEERLVVVKQLFLVEEVHIRHVLESHAVREAVTLRRQHAVVERLNRQGTASADEATPEEGAAFAAEGGHHGSTG